MPELKIEYPFVDNGVERKDLVRHYAEDEKGVRYYVLQNETGSYYEEAIDMFPCRYSYTATDMPVREEIEN